MLRPLFFGLAIGCSTAGIAVSAPRQFQVPQILRDSGVEMEFKCQETSWQWTTTYTKQYLTAADLPAQGIQVGFYENRLVLSPKADFPNYATYMLAGLNNASSFYLEEIDGPSSYTVQWAHSRPMMRPAPSGLVTLTLDPSALNVRIEIEDGYQDWATYKKLECQGTLPFN